MGHITEHVVTGTVQSFPDFTLYQKSSTDKPLDSDSVLGLQRHSVQIQGPREDDVLAARTDLTIFSKSCIQHKAILSNV